MVLGRTTNLLYSIAARWEDKIHEKLILLARAF